MNNIYALAGLLTYSPLACLPVLICLNSGELIRQWLRSLQLRDSYGITPYSLLILSSIAAEKPKALQKYNKNL